MSVRFSELLLDLKSCNPNHTQARIERFVIRVAILDQIFQVKLRFRLRFQLRADLKNSFAAWSSTRSRSGEDILEGPLMGSAERSVVRVD